VLLLAASVLLVLGKTHQDAVSRLRMLAIDAIAPVLDVMSRPVDAGTQAIAEVERFWNTYQDNRQLRQDNLRLLQWQEVARRLEQENAILRGQLHFAGENQPTFVSARVIGDSGGPFVKTLLVNAGIRHGVAPGQAAVTAAGLVGRVVEAGERASRLLLLTDLNSRVPVLVEGSRYRGILAGNNSRRPSLIFLPANAKVAAGDRIVTSGHGGVFPPGLAVGMVSAVVDNEIRVQPFVDWDRMEYISVLRYQTPQLEKLRPDGAPARVDGG
jgi:rod shape-determining protein MreC